MNAPTLTREESFQLLRLTSDAYALTVRQAPDKAKVFTGATKERDRKPVDPPPIVQLKITDPEDPAQNYLQSPYFFMVANLQDADLNRPEPNVPGLLGDDINIAIQSALAGTLVSSLHRLKDVDNKGRLYDGGFFVFPDLSVKIEGTFRLRFSLFEMLKTRVAYIKSELSDPFTVYTPRAFPGMSESTFLSRSFGDQGVKLRIRKEPRVLGKRSAPSDNYSPDIAQAAPNQGNSDFPQHGHSGRRENGAAGSRTSYDDPPFKRQRTSIDLARRSVYEQDPQLSQRTYMQPRDPLAPLPPRDLQTTGRGSYYSQGASSTSGSTVADYSYGGHQRTNSSSTSSPHTSPHNEFHGYPFSTSTNTLYQPLGREQSYQYLQTQYSDTSSRQIPQLSQHAQSYRPLSSSMPSQMEYNRAYSRAYDMEAQTQSPADRGYGAFQPSFRQDHYPSQIPTTLPDRSMQTQGRTLPDPSQPLNSVLPPLQSTLPSSQPRRDPFHNYANTNGGSGTEESSQTHGSSQSGPDNQGFMSNLYRNEQNG